MSDDRLTQPIEMRIQPEPSFRELLIGMTGELGAMRVSLRHLEEGARQRDDKLDILADRLDEINATVQKGIGASQVQDRDLTELQSTVFGNIARNERGLVSRVGDLEQSNARSRNIAIGIALGSGIGGTWLGALLKKWGYL